MMLWWAQYSDRGNTGVIIRAATLVFRRSKFRFGLSSGGTHGGRCCSLWYKVLLIDFNSRYDNDVLSQVQRGGGWVLLASFMHICIVSWARCLKKCGVETRKLVTFTFICKNYGWLSSSSYTAARTASLSVNASKHAVIKGDFVKCRFLVFKYDYKFILNLFT